MDLTYILHLESTGLADDQTLGEDGLVTERGPKGRNYLHSSPYPQSLDQGLAHSRCSRTVCLINVSTLSAKLCDPWLSPLLRTGPLLAHILLCKLERRVPSSMWMLSITREHRLMSRAWAMFQLPLTPSAGTRVQYTACTTTYGSPGFTSLGDCSVALILVLMGRISGLRGKKLPARGHHNYCRDCASSLCPLNPWGLFNFGATLSLPNHSAHQ